MKTTVFATMLAVGSLGLTVPAFAADGASATEEAPVAADSVAVTTVVVKGGG